MGKRDTEYIVNERRKIMEFTIQKKPAFSLIGYSGAGKWKQPIVYPIPELWKKAEQFIKTHQPLYITGVCLPPRSDHYFYTCGIEQERVAYEEVNEGMTVHTFPFLRYAVFTHRGPAHLIPQTYDRIWNTFDEEGFNLLPGGPEIERVSVSLFGKEKADDYEMEIWLPII